jgi:putative ABC transport system permease protein
MSDSQYPDMSISCDLRHAVRLLGRSPVFTVTAVLSLALGIAATAAIFSLADAMLLRPRTGVAHPETLVDIGRTTRGEGFDNFGYPLFVAMRDQTTLVEEMSAQRWGPEVMSLGDAQSSERVFASIVSGNYFHVTGTRAALGRFFLPEEDRTVGTHPVVVLSHQLWARRFTANPDIVGQTIRLNNLPYTVVGVAEADFEGTTVFSTDFWLPAAMEAHVRASDRSLLTDHESVWMVALGRLKAGVTTQQARDELNAIARRYLAEHTPDRLERWGIDVARSSRVPAPIAGSVIGFIAVLGVLTGLVLLIACTNVASMLLARALERRREVATRLAIGASRGRIVTQLLIEGLTLAIIAGAISVPVAQGLTALLSSFQPSIPIPLALHLQVDPRVMGFAFALSALAAVLFALLPALQATRFDVAPALHGASATADKRRAWLRQGMVAAQVAMALLLLVAAGLFLRSLQEAATVDAGFAVENVDTLQIDTRIAGYRTPADANRVVDALAERFRRIPGVTAVGASRMVPLMGGRLGLGGLRAPGYTGGPDGSDRIDADWDIVTPGFFDALQLRLIRGRPFSDGDREGAPYVAIVNETMAGRLWPGRDPVGQKLLQQTGREASDQRGLEIVGVAHDAKYAYITDQERNFIYVPAAQQGATEMTFYLRRSTSSSRIAEMRQAVVGFDPMLPVIHTQTLKEATAIALLPQRIAAWIAASVGSIGLLLAALGLYGLTAFSVAQRTREIALRMALGASRKAVLSLVLRQSGRLAIVGTAAGFALAVGLGMLLRSLLVGVGSVDPVAFGVATLILSGVLLAASWVPARRASRLDPMRALRAE